MTNKKIDYASLLALPRADITPDELADQLDALGKMNCDLQVAQQVRELLTVWKRLSDEGQSQFRRWVRTQVDGAP